MSDFAFWIEVAGVFLVMVCVLVAAHELGHYLFARLFGMGVEEFAIGMGKRLTVWARRSHDIPVPADYVHDVGQASPGYGLEGGNLHRPDSHVLETPAGRVLRETTDFTFRLLPLGGFVRIKGMIPQEDGSEVRIPGGFYSKAPWKRFIVLLAGPVFSVLAGMILLMGVFMTDGVLKPVNRPILGSVNDRGQSVAAYNAGLRKDDEILQIGGKSVSTFYELVQVVQAHPNESLDIVYRRGTEERHTTAKPTLAETLVFQPDMSSSLDTKVAGVLGVTPQTRHRKLAFGEAFTEVGRIPGQAIESLVRLVKKPSRLKKEAGGAVSMVQMTGEATKQGIASLVAVAALISISVGIFNLLPIPPLDGGQMVMAVAEMLRGGRRLSIQVQSWVTSAGLVTVLLLAVLALFVDFQRISDNAEKPASKSASAPAPSESR